MKQYLDLVKHVLEHGVRKESRTGVDTLAVFGAHYRVDLAEGFPLVTTKKMFFKSMLRELLWYLSGENHIRNLRKHTKIWDAWADEDGNLDTAYGYYWRRFPSAQRSDSGGGGSGGGDSGNNGVDADGDRSWLVREVDQIGYVLHKLKTEPTSRRMVVTAWEPGNATTSKLPPCHYTFAFNVLDGRLNCHLNQRSGDIALGIPFNLAAYATLTMMMAQEAGLEPGVFSHFIVDAHIYTRSPDGRNAEFDHVPGLIAQLEREPRPLPELVIARRDVDDLEFEDFELKGYDPHPKINFGVAV